MSKPYPGGALNTEIKIEIESDLTVPWNDVARFRDDLADLSDDSLIGLVRNGSADAYAVLFERYRLAATRLAAYFSNSVDAKDIVAESFAQVYDQLRRGKGPQTSFRGYLLTSVRREAGRRAKVRKRVTPTDNIDVVDRPVLFGNGAIDGFERDLVRTAFTSLPKRWQKVLWLIDVDGRKPSEVAPMLGLKPNSVSALAYRAREGMRRAYLEQHVTTTNMSLPASCREVRQRLVAFVRDSATERDLAVIEPHVETCATCMGAYVELKELNTHFGAVSGAVALSVVAPTSAGVVSVLATKAAVVAKTVAVATGSTAAIIATSMTVLNAPLLELPAGAETVHVQSSTATRQHEPDRNVGPAADRTLEMSQPTSSSSTTSASTNGTGPGQGQTDAQAPSSGTSSAATIAVDGTKVSTSVSAARVKTSVSVDVQKPLDTRITIKSDKAGTGGIDTPKVTDKVQKLVGDVGKL